MSTHLLLPYRNSRLSVPSLLPPKKSPFLLEFQKAHVALVTQTRPTAMSEPTPGVEESEQPRRLGGRRDPPPKLGPNKAKAETDAKGCRASLACAEETEAPKGTRNTYTHGHRAGLLRQQGGISPQSGSLPWGPGLYWRAGHQRGRSKKAPVARAPN